MDRPTSDKLQKLFLLLERSPADPFLLYGIALEYRKLHAPHAAIEFLDKTISTDANYCYAYYQRGQILEELGDPQGAILSYNAGIEAAKRTRDEKARSELEAAIQMIAAD